jgi:glycine oxidase
MPQVQQSPDAIIIGAGVVGLASAYFLASQYKLRCLVIEKDAIGSQASGGAAGELSAVHRHSAGAEFTKLCLESIRLHWEMAPILMEESGIDYKLSSLPMLRPAIDEEEIPDLLAQMEWQSGLGMETEWVSGKALHELNSWLTHGSPGAVYCLEQQLEAYPYTLALAQAAEKHGVLIQTGEVTGLLHNGARVDGVISGNDKIPAGIVLMANGPWAKFTNEWTGLDLPIKPLRGQIVHLNSPIPLPQQAIFHESGYVLPKPGGDLLVGTTEEDVGFVKQTTSAAQTQIMETAIRLAPQIVDFPIREITACLRPYSLDELPLIGPVPGWTGLYLATGHGFKGIVLSLATGKYLAQLIVQNRSDYPLDPFSVQRLLVGK